MKRLLSLFLTLSLLAHTVTASPFLSANSKPRVLPTPVFLEQGLLLPVTSSGIYLGTSAKMQINTMAREGLVPASLFGKDWWGAVVLASVIEETVRWMVDYYATCAMEIGPALGIVFMCAILYGIYLAGHYELYHEDVTIAHHEVSFRPFTFLELIFYTTGMAAVMSALAIYNLHDPAWVDRMPLWDLLVQGLSDTMGALHEGVSLIPGASDLLSQVPFPSTYRTLAANIELHAFLNAATILFFKNVRPASLFRSHLARQGA